MEMQTDKKHSDLEKIGIVSLGCSSGWFITQAMANMQYNYMSYPHEEMKPYSMYVDPGSFFSSDHEYRNRWRYPVLIDGIFLYADVARRSQRITIVFLVIALSIPFIRALSVFFMLNQDFRFRRNERGFITGVTWSRRPGPITQPSIRDSVMSIWTAHEKTTLTEEEVKKLPLIQFGITELSETIKTYKSNEDKEKDIDEKGEEESGDEKEKGTHNESDGTNIVFTISETQNVGGRESIWSGIEDEARDAASIQSDTQDEAQDRDGQLIRRSVIQDMVQDEDSISSDIVNENDDSIRNNNQLEVQDGETTRSEVPERSQDEGQPLMTNTLPQEESRTSDMGSHDEIEHPSSSSPKEKMMGTISQSFINDAYASCFACSVCLCDFEHGEEVRLLPKCGHYFHDECIMPWLIEKKSSCPLCQTDVLHRDDEEE